MSKPITLDHIKTLLTVIRIKNKEVDERYEMKRSSQDTIALLSETDMIPAVKNADGKILTNGKGQVLLRY